jgi:hypothetical protein
VRFRLLWIVRPKVAAGTAGRRLRLNRSAFDDLPVLARMSPAEAAAKLRELGEEEEAAILEAAQEGPRGETFGVSDWMPFRERAWKHTAHAFGYLAPADPGNATLPIRHAGNMVGDASLKNSRIRITLNRLRVADYPGGGVHRVLFDFYAQNQLPGTVEHLHYNVTSKAYQGQEAAVIGYPIFVGLNVGAEGVAFRCVTVNVQNEDDEAFLGFLDSEILQGGLQLATIAQPAIAPLSQIAIGLTKSIAKRYRNVAVQEFSMGLDFTRNAMGARLAEGDYIVVQVPQKMRVVWNWDEWVYDPANGQIVSATDSAALIPFNYLVLSISRYNGP